MILAYANGLNAMQPVLITPSDVASPLNDWSWAHSKVLNDYVFHPAYLSSMSFEYFFSSIFTIHAFILENSFTMKHDIMKYW